MRTRRFGGQTLFLTLGLALGATVLMASRAQAQTPPAEAPVPDAVSGEPSPSDKPPEPAPGVPGGVPGDAAAAGAVAATAGATGTEPAPGAAAAGQPGTYSRRGLFFTVGLGTSIVAYQLDLREGDALTYTGPITELVPATMLKIGYGIGDQTAVHLTNRIAWLAHNDWAAVDFHERILTMSSMTGLGVTHFIDREQRSVYVGADLGISQWLAFQDIGLDVRDVGFGACLELGYEFAKSVSFEHSVCWGTVSSHRRSEDNGTERDADLGMPLTASFTVNYLK